jgi:hypothetical protein
LDLTQLAIAAGELLGAGGIALLLRPWAPVARDWLWYHHCNRVEKRAVKRGQNPSSLKMIEVARQGSSPRTEQGLRPLPGKPDGRRAA